MKAKPIEHGKTRNRDDYCHAARSDGWRCLKRVRRGQRFCFVHGGRTRLVTLEVPRDVEIRLVKKAAA